MHSTKLHPRLIRNKLIPLVLSIVVGLPILSQPLGLFMVWNFAEAGAGETKTAGAADPGSIENSYAPEPAGGIDYADETFNRSFNENRVDINETAPDVLEGEDEEDAASPDWTEDIPLYWDIAPEPTDSPSYAVDYTLYISANELNLRAKPSTDSEVLAELKFGDKVHCSVENSEWMLVTFNGVAGYVKSEYTSRDMVFKSVSETVYVDANKLNLRKEPSTTGTIMMTLGYMQKLTRTGIGDGWSKVRTPSGKVGYAASEYLTKRGPAKASPVSGSASYASTGNRVVDLAYSALGVRYVHNSSSLSGFDCSGLTSWIYRQIGITIPRSTSGYYNIGTGISYSDIKPGDILCMDTRRRDGKTSITHVAIYVGDGMMIHASSTRHKVVLQNVSQYLGWGVKLITVRRILD